MHILVAEDNLINQKVVVRMLEKLAYLADVVSDGTLAVEATRSTQYDIILMDVNMPTMGGIEASEVIRSEESSGDRAHIIALTGNAMDADRLRCLEAGMDDYISKPFVLETLREKLRVAAASLNRAAEKN